MLELLQSEDLTNPSYLSVQASPVDGRGLFTTRPFRAGETIAIIAGELISRAEAIRREAEEGNYYIFFLREDVFIDGAPGIGRWVNHSCTPSAEVTTRDDRSLWLRALHEVAAGSELTIDYDDGQIYDFCRSRNPSCRGAQCPRAAAP